MRLPVNMYVLLLSLLCCHALRAQQLVMRGDHPDPSVVKIGDTYWATATTSNWAPAFPIMRSKDLVRWETVAHVFPKLPDWADYYFWAPEITYENGKVYLYYSAHRKNGNLCIAVASADRPEGPYTDHGPLMCQDVGSIDAFPMRDENGQLYMIWKEDGNSVNKPTPIWAMPMNEARTALTGTKKELFRNDAPWEANLVEGVSMARHNGYYYAFYAAAGCCGAGCTYGTGVARARSLLGPWEKHPRNPLITHTPEWKCPGHGTPVEKDGRYYFLYHGYNSKTSVFTGREGLLMEYRLTSDGWIEFIPAPAGRPARQENFSDGFGNNHLSRQWQWSVFQAPAYRSRGGELYVNALAEHAGRFLGVKTTSGNYTASLRVHRKKTTAAAGLAIIGDEQNTITAWIGNDSVWVSRLKGGKDSILYRGAAPRQRKTMLQAEVSNGSQVQFYLGQGNSRQPLLPQPVDGAYLPPWDRALRVGLSARGTEDRVAVFDKFSVNNR